MWCDKGDDEQPDAMLDHMDAQRRCERPEVKHYETYNMHQQTARMYIKSNPQLFEDEEALASLREYMRRSMLLKLSTNEYRTAVVSSDMWKVCLFISHSQYISNKYVINIQYIINIQYLVDNSIDKDYDKIIAGFYSNVTTQTLSYLFGFIVNDYTLSAKRFLSTTSAEHSHFVTTAWIHEDDTVKTLRESYMNKCIAPSSVIIWFRDRTKQHELISALSITGWSYQSFKQYTALRGCLFDFYTKERYLDSIIFILSIYYTYIMYILYYTPGIWL